MNTDAPGSFSRRLTLAILVIGGVVGAAYALPLDGEPHGGSWRLLGRFHPLLVHFPVALLLLVPVLEWLGRNRPAYKEAAGFLLGLALIAAIAAVFAGLALARADGHEGMVLSDHLRGGVAVVIGTTLAWLTRKRFRIAYGLLLTGSLAALMWAAHNGGSLTHGADYLTESLPPALKQVLHIRETPKPEIYAPETVFGGAVRPVLEKYCFSCHGPEKQKGDYRMDTFAALLAGGKTGKIAIAPKDLGGSELVHRLALEPDDERAMPPRKKPHPKPAQIALIRWWVKQGASRDQLITTVKDAPPEIAAQLLALVETAEPAESIYVPRVGDYSALKAEILQLETKLGVKFTPVSHRAGDGLILRTRTAGKHFGDAELSQLATIAPFIVDAELAESGVTDAGLTALKAFKQLEKLRLERTTLTGKTLGELKVLSQLTYLNLSLTEVSDDALTALGQLSSLRQLYLFGTKITPGGLKRLRTTLPLCAIGDVEPPPTENPKSG